MFAVNLYMWRQCRTARGYLYFYFSKQKSKKSEVKAVKMRIVQLGGDEENGDKSRTFVFHDEGHTLGNALRCIISSYPEVQFCGYTVPHPAESKMHFRIQMHNGRAVDTLKKGLEDLVKMCDHTIGLFEQEVDTFKVTNKIKSANISQ